MKNFLEIKINPTPYENREGSFEDLDDLNKSGDMIGFGESRIEVQEEQQNSILLENLLSDI